VAIAEPTTEKPPTVRQVVRNPHSSLPNWLYPSFVVLALGAFAVYAGWVVFFQREGYYAPYLSPFDSPLIKVGPIPPGVWVAWAPFAFRLTCYYYRKAYYRAFWRAPAACAVREPHAKYTGETRFPLILQNVHRYFFWIAMAFNVILSIDAVIAFRNHAGQWGHMGLGTLVLVVNAALLWLYSLSCHACRHAVGGRLRHFSKHPVRYWLWTQVSRLNTSHMQYAWLSLFWVLLTDLYIRLVASGAITDPRFF
jgi:hypothetical protein